MTVKMNQTYTKVVLVLSFVAFMAGVPQHLFSQSKQEMPALLSQREQMEVREGWLRKRLGTLLPGMMKRHGIDMWIVVNEEFNSDPVTPHITPPIPIVGRRDVFIFIDRGETIERIAMVRYDEERLKNHYRMVMPARDKFGEELKKIVDERAPKTIALNIGGSRGQQSGLSYDSYRFLAGSLGAENEKKFISAADLLVEFFDTRLPEELEHYRNAVAATELIARRAFSNEVITPGKTTVGDYGDFVHQTDWSVGQVLAALEEAPEDVVEEVLRSEAELGYVGLLRSLRHEGRVGLLQTRAAVLEHRGADVGRGDAERVAEAAQTAHEREAFVVGLHAVVDRGDPMRVQIDVVAHALASVARARASSFKRGSNTSRVLCSGCSIT